jgi:hypothetical protein
MHSGFVRLRDELGVNVRLRRARTPSAVAAAGIARVVEIWHEGRERFGRGTYWPQRTTARSSVPVSTEPMRHRYGTAIKPRTYGGRLSQVSRRTPPSLTTSKDWT